MSSAPTTGSDTAKQGQPKAAKPVRDDPAESERLCNKWVQSGLTKNVHIQFLMKTLIDLGCTPPDHFIRCMQCHNPVAGAFGMVEETVIGRDEQGSTTKNKVATAKEQCHRSYGDLQEQLRREESGASSLQLKPEIFLCQQYLDSELMTHKTLHHELIHAIDLCRAKMDPLHNCIHMACTEIRAENLSGECSFWRELPLMSSLRGHGKECVRRRALLSVRANPNCTQRAEDYVDAAMERCFHDIYPFDRHPNQR